MHLREFFDRDAINLDLGGTGRDEILRELVALLRLGTDSAELVRMLKRRENLGSTGIGRGIAIPHCRSNLVERLRVAYGRRQAGIDFNAIDNQPVHDFFLIVAPPIEVSNQYLPVLGRLAQFARVPEIPGRLRAVTSADEFLELLDQFG